MQDIENNGLLHAREHALDARGSEEALHRNLDSSKMGDEQQRASTPLCAQGLENQEGESSFQNPALRTGREYFVRWYKVEAKEAAPAHTLAFPAGISAAMPHPRWPSGLAGVLRSLRRFGWPSDWAALVSKTVLIVDGVYPDSFQVTRSAATTIYATGTEELERDPGGGSPRSADHSSALNIGEFVLLSNSKSAFVRLVLSLNPVPALHETLHSDSRLRSHQKGDKRTFTPLPLIGFDFDPESFL
ncbi:hypothetical protein G7Y89_g900 [Cudoniella acicularis]|uniref:Uncharacterized protein n=1 Tax=Cudoniella acicularis TaxID=354080 RepID=A0A8H4RWC2_9HELO|nr:hypothetical protein G7Y89_g900 [Cudoniella acicularis]